MATPTETRIAMIGLDTSHTVEFTRRFQAPDCDPQTHVDGVRVVTCLRFPSVFRDETAQDEWAARLESWGVNVTRDLDEAVADVDAVMLESNDPSVHLEWIERLVGLDKPIFIDKPLADTAAHARQAMALIERAGINCCSASSLRFVPELATALDDVDQPQFVSTYGPVNPSVSGSAIVYYGVHAVEMAQRAAGRGAGRVTTVTTGEGMVLVFGYPDGRRAVVELAAGSSVYGGTLRTAKRTAPFVVDMSGAYAAQLERLVPFLAGGPPPSELTDAVEVTAMLEAAERSLQSGREELV